MRIGIISNLYPTKRRPNFGIFVKDQLDHLSKKVEIRLIAPLPNQKWLDKLFERRPNETYPVMRPFSLAFPRWFMQNLYPSSMAYTLKRYGSDFFKDCDIIHAHYAFPDGVAVVKAFGNRKPLVLTVHGSDINLFAMKTHLKKNIVEALNKINLIICVSNSLVETLRELGVKTKTEVIPNGIDTALFAPGSKEDACRFLGLNPGIHRILFAGNFLKVKGIEYLIQAMPILRRSYPECELVLLGARPGSGDLVRYNGLIAETGMTGAVRIVAAVPHGALSRWIQAADLFALPSIKEGFGLVAAEALACGRPVVATKSGGPEDIVMEGTGVLVRPGDYKELGSGLVQALDGQGIIESEKIAESARLRFSFETVTQKIVDVYERVL